MSTWATGSIANPCGSLIVSSGSGFGCAAATDASSRAEIPQPGEGWLRAREVTVYRSGVMVSAITLFPSAVTTPTSVMASPLFRNS